jgi:putative ABC transport system permease protein
VSAGFFPILGVPPAVGRVLRDDENLAGRERAVVLGHGLWLRRFGGDPGLVGRTVALNGASYTVVGVMPRGFQYPEQAELWTPLAPVAPYEDLLASRGSLWLEVTARLAPGVSLDEAQAEMDAIVGAMNQEYPDDPRYGVKLEPLREHVSGDVRPALLVLLGAVGLVLLIACANVANLLLARASGRRREIAIRSALGAGRVRVVRQLLTESLLLSFAGGVLGLVLADVAVGAFVASGPAGLPRLEAVRTDATILAFAAVATFLTGLVFGLVPALQTFRDAVGEPLSDAARGSSEGGTHRVRSAFVVAQTALAVVLLVGAGLLVRSFVRILGLDPGLDASQVATLRLALPATRYPEPDRVRGFYDRLLSDVRSLPGVRSAGAATSLLLSRLPASSTLSVQGQPPPPPGTPNEPVTLDTVTTGFFETLRVPLKRGRLFEARDARSAEELRANPFAPRIAVVNEAMVRRFFSGQDPLGRRISFDDPSRPDANWSEIVGVVGDVRRSGLDKEPRAEVYFYQGDSPDRRQHLVVRAEGDPFVAARAVQAAVWAIDPDQPVSGVRTLEDLLRGTVAERRLSMLLLSGFGALALGLAALGLYGVMAYSTAQRTRELGIRLALGAQPRDVMGLVLRDGTRLAALGLGIGVAFALAGSRAVSSLLYGVPPNDPTTFAAVVAVLGGATLLASYLPARRAAGVDPVSALRNE